MVRLEEAVIARVEVQGKNFEVLVDPRLALELKRGKEVDVRELLAVDRVFRDARKGEEVPTKDLLGAFGTTDVFKAAVEIVKRGQVQLTTEMRRRMREERLKQIASIIARQAVNPQTGTPHPAPRIEAAIQQAGVRIDEFKSAEEQVPAVVRALSAILPMSLQTKKVELKVPASHVGKVYGLLRSYNPLKEEWGSDGSLLLQLELPAGIFAELMDKLSQLTKGEIKVEETR